MVGVFSAWTPPVAGEQAWRGSWGVDDELVGTMEVPRGAFLEALVDAGAAVYSTNPKRSDRFRDRHTVAGARDDRREAFVLADALRTDPHCFRRVEPQL